MEYYVHHVPGRLRIQTPFIHHNEDNAHTLCAYAGCITGVASVETYAPTGSVTIHYDVKHVSCEKLLCLLEQKGWFHLIHAKTNDELVKEESEKVIEVAFKIAESVEGGIE
ncbi:MAG: HMA2 domain-containing protein [Dissulfurispiraceae bacterium]|jgi:hypothetical protein